ncbi:ATP-binding response regulator [Caulobacter vibrioides]|uniref:CBS pair-family sensor histidine kinase/receiver domain protein n=1 Tax=Caulobacter vibrioides (strain NA1000 / CB15N) TaxID=565050 RepID=A0A0H3CCV4_CAUVN|nr:response regulator [Caulobacter vibrioides]YP_002518638.2 CBS pair-family sensor histidine kinase/receiver domain protein [Caulobacter vibrioides NA1000]ACL96730.2 CBS pair-family sensor histidine kinase/receiver domain protein [Caulobacter vibrioides NA1000]ATC29989.1 hybrid sensor histidine kinase/response regulator [Caulobacter vibrioides]QXZ51511.1 response regulator [Caulobacter vibrioides]
METLSRLIEPLAPIAPGTPSATVAAMFDANPTFAALAVVDDGAPVGLVYRDVLQGMMRVAGPALATRPVAEIMDAKPRMVPVGTDPNTFVNALADSPTPIFRTAYVAVDADGRYAGVGGLASLLASHRRRQHEARDAMAIVERMAVDIGAHLDGVLAITERLEQQRLTPDAAAFVRAIGDTSRDMGETVGRAVDLHRSVNGDLQMDAAPTRLRDFADLVEARWANRASEGGSTLLVSYDGDPECGVEIDGERLLQVIDILVENALSAGRGMIEVRLSARAEDDRITLDCQLRDNAGGHAEDRLRRVNDPLGGVGGQDRSEMALGVGLALAQSVVRTMGGRLIAEANRGAGLTVGFSLPLIPAAAEAAAQDAPEPVGGRSAHILIVDDNATNRMVAEALCDMFECTSEQAVDGVEAVEMARSGRFDLILMDIKMPRMDGVAATRAIRELSGRSSAAPIVALTANADPADVHTYLAAGMQDVVEKPIKPERLALVLNSLLAGADGDSAEAAA